MEIKFTKHALDMLKERNFTQEIIENVVRKPDWRRIEEDIWHGFKRMENKVLHVVVKEKEESYTVVTMFFDRRIKENESKSRLRK